MYGEVQKKKHKQNCRHITKELPFIMQIEEKEICFPLNPRDSEQRMVNSKLRDPIPHTPRSFFIGMLPSQTYFPDFNSQK